MRCRRVGCKDALRTTVLFQRLGIAECYKQHSSPTESQKTLLQLMAYSFNYRG